MTNEKKSVTAEIRPVDVMEAVAAFTHGPEPSAAVASEWLERNEDALVEAMEEAFRKYLKVNWKKLAWPAGKPEDL